MLAAAEGLRNAIGSNWRRGRQWRWRPHRQRWSSLMWHKFYITQFINDWMNTSAVQAWGVFVCWLDVVVLGIGRYCAVEQIVSSQDAVNVGIFVICNGIQKTQTFRKFVFNRLLQEHNVKRFLMPNNKQEEFSCIDASQSGTANLIYHRCRYCIHFDCLT